MKILIVTEYYWPHIGGVEIVFKNLAEGLIKRGHEVKVVTAQVPDTKAQENLNGVEIHRVKVPKFAARYFFTLLSFQKIWTQARDVDLIHTTLYNAALPAWFVAKFRRKKAVLSVHEVYGKRWTERFKISYVWATFHRILERVILMLKFPAYVCVSQATMDDFEPYKPYKSITKVIHNGIDNELFNPQKYDVKKEREKLNLKDFTYLFYGRPGISKGLEYLLRAVPEIHQNIPQSQGLFIVSKDPKKGYKQAQKIIRKLKIEDKIKLIKPVPYHELPRYLKAVDCVVIPSLAEGFGFTAAESCAMETPVVVSETASLPEVASGKVVFVPPKDSKAIAQGVIKIHKKEFQKIPKKNFSWDKNVEEHLKIYKELCPQNH